MSGDRQKQNYRKLFGCFYQHFAANRVLRRNAEDLAQDAVSRLLKQDPQLQGIYGTAYLHKVARSVAFDETRTRKSQLYYFHCISFEVLNGLGELASEYLMAQNQLTRQEQLEEAELHEAVSKALNSLSPVDRDLLLNLLVQNLPGKSAARLAGCHESTITYRKQQALKQLRNQLSDLGE